MVQSWNHLALKRPECLLHLWSPGNGSQPRVFRGTSAGSGTLSRFGTVCSPGHQDPCFCDLAAFQERNSSRNTGVRKSVSWVNKKGKVQQFSPQGSPCSPAPSRCPLGGHFHQRSRRPPPRREPQSPCFPPFLWSVVPIRTPFLGAPLWPSALCL